MTDIKDLIIKKNNITAPLIAIIISIPVVFMAIYIYGEIIFLVPVISFLSFHYTKLYRIKKRILGSIVIFLAVAFIFTGIYSDVAYYSSPVYHTTLSDGSSVTASVSPYSGTGGSYNFSFTISPNGTLQYSSVELNISSGQTFKMIPYSKLNPALSNGSEHFYYIAKGLPEGIYQFNITAQKNGTITTQDMSGPINAPVYYLIEALLPVYSTIYIVYFELIFITGIFIGRSISNSMRRSSDKNAGK